MICLVFSHKFLKRGVNFIKVERWVIPLLSQLNGLHGSLLPVRSQVQIPAREIIINSKEKGIINLNLNNIVKEPAVVAEQSKATGFPCMSYWH